MAATMSTTRIIPHTMPALKIPPTTLQLESVQASRKTYMLIFFIIVL